MSSHCVRCTSICADVMAMRHNSATCLGAALGGRDDVCEGGVEVVLDQCMHCVFVQHAMHRSSGSLPHQQCNV